MVGDLYCDSSISIASGSWTGCMKKQQQIWLKRQRLVQNKRHSMETDSQTPSHFMQHTQARWNTDLIGTGTVQPHLSDLSSAAYQINDIHEVFTAL